MSYFYQRGIRHTGLNKYRIIKAQTHHELEEKCNAVLAQWDEQWNRKQEREKKIRNAEESVKYAAELSREANDIQEKLDLILTDSLSPEPFDFDTMRDLTYFSVAKPRVPQYLPLPVAPRRGSAQYNPEPPFFTRISKKKMEAFEKRYDSYFRGDYRAWEKSYTECERENERREALYRKNVDAWEREKEKYYQEQKEKNKAIDEFEAAFKQRDIPAVEQYFSLLLGSIEYPISYERSIDIEYSPEERNIIVDLRLPILEDIPKLKAVTYIKSKNEYKESYYPESYLKKKYDHVIYQMVLQVLNDIFSTTDDTLINAVAVNGKIRTVDKATGKRIEPYILSINIGREEFFEINLDAVDPKLWFRSAKGVSAATFANVTPIAPLVQMKREDHRFIDAYTVVDKIDEGVNLASMDWRDFENLIREIFEKEFNASGGEVKITQTSRDGGVDAVAFDPDPIRGGKIVIQAKRYTNVVGVSAVRDLYGTVLNEGATKGILVTTSNYGNDAYSFAQGKPLTLMNGANLLFLMEKHGHRARIDIKEARKTLGLVKD